MFCAAALAVCLLAWLGQRVEAATWRLPLQRHHAARDGASLQAPHTLASRLFPGAPSSGDGGEHPRVWTPSFPIVEATSEVTFEAIQRRGSNGIELFTTEVLVGTPPQPVSVAFDVFSGDVLVLNHKLQGHAFYDHTKSTSYVANGTRVKINNEIDGVVSNDCFTVGSVGVKRQLLIELEGPDEKLSTFPVKYDGEIGLGSRSVFMPGTPSLVREMINQNLLDRPVVGLHLGETDAHVLFGGTDDKYTSKDVVYFPHYTDEPFGWWAHVNGVSVDDKLVVGTSKPAAIMLVPYILGPSDQIQALADAVGAEYQDIPCDGPGPDITLHLGSLNVTLTKKDYAIPQNSSSCLFPFVSGEPYGWIFGTPFLRNVYTVMDFTTEGQEHLGLASIRNL